MLSTSVVEKSVEFEPVTTSTSVWPRFPATGPSRVRTSDPIFSRYQRAALHPDELRDSELRAVRRQLLLTAAFAYASMQRLRDAGNTLVVVEHDPAVMLAADRLIDMGPGPGERGGRIVYDGTPEGARHAYAALYDQGHVHSFEVWNKAGDLVGGGYGIVVNDTFVIESQFSQESNSSKFGFSVLGWHLAKWGFRLADNKWSTPTTLQMGFREIPRAEYLRLLRKREGRRSKRGRWEIEAGSKIVADWDAEALRNARCEI